MAKRKTFEAILNSEFRWPSPDDEAFSVADDPSENATISDDGFARLVLMTEGYKRAADLMVEAAAGDNLSRDTLVFPIIFNYRQFLELSLKYQIATFGPAVGVEPNWTSHDLAKLWAEFLAIMERFGTADPDEVDPVVERIILEFAKIDPGSYSYRYPVDRKGNPVPVAYPDLHLPTLADVMQGVAGYFTGCDGYFRSLLDASA
ncbi:MULTISPECIES: hypothetical protein [unclassified Sulfitobacter]|uniref:hypothetical protein n=1 Tax=unclassified Sulfitobacter TaxID=196795 RepID=UPI0037476CFC